MTYFMAHIRQKDIFPYIREVIEFITRISEQGNIEFIETILYYLTNKVNTKKINDIFSEFKKAVTLEHKENIMTVAERLEQRGIQIGRQEGKTQGIKNVALNMISENMDAKLIAKFTGMTIEAINKLKGN